MLVTLCLLSIVALYVLAIFPGRFWNPVIDEPDPFPESWPKVDIIVPARNEGEILPQTLPDLLEQDYPGVFRVILVDDHSEDDTGGTATRLARDAGKSDKLTLVKAPDMPEGWVGKVAAMQAGVAASDAPYILFTDADILHPGFSLRQIVAKAVRNNYDMTSLMVRLNCVSLPERLTIPAFVFFFSMLYPFRLVADPKSKVAAAAGGVMLVKRAALDKAGGLESIKDALIDDCSLARRIKETDGTLSLALSKDTKSLRRYPDIRDIHDMVARTAFTQLKKSNRLVALSLLAMAIVFLSPVFAFLSFQTNLMFLGGIAWFVMAALYAPVVLLYGLPLLWAATLPFAAIFYMVATFDSARQTWKGQGGLWKGRTQKS